jgi:hypothetical protein
VIVHIHLSVFPEQEAHFLFSKHFRWTSCSRRRNGLFTENTELRLLLQQNSSENSSPGNFNEGQTIHGGETTMPSPALTRSSIVQ